MGKLSPFLKLSISPKCFVSVFVYCASKLESVEHCLWRKQHDDTINFISIFYRIPFMPEGSIKRFESAWVLSRGFKKSWMTTKVRQFRSFTLIFLKRKELLDFVAEIQTVTDNDPSKSIRSIVRDMKVSDFFIKQVIYKDIKYFHTWWWLGFMAHQTL